jgi:putative endonuclease
VKNLNYQTGKLGENLAKQYLIKKGYKILKSNFRSRFGEIDIIASKNKTLVFIEVKLKIGEETGQPEEMINHRKINQVQKIAEIFLQTNPSVSQKFPLWRIDAICIVLKPDCSSKRITHWKNISDEMV